MKDYINVLLASGDSIQLIADVDFDVVGQDLDKFEAVHIADVLYQAILDKTRGQGKALLRPGNYTARMMVTIVGEPDEIPRSRD